MTLTLQATKGLLWSSVSRVLQLLIQLSITIILARLLTPEDFGVVAISLIFVTLASILNEMGLSAAIIQRQNITEEHLSTVFYVNIGSGIFLTIMVITVSPWVASFFHKAILGSVLNLFSLNFIISSFGMVQRSILEKQLEFFKIAWIEVISLMLSAVIGIGLALMGHGVWSLVWQFLSNVLGLTLLFWFLGGWRPKLMFEIGKLKELLSFSLNLLGNNLVYFARSLDIFLIGKFIGPVPLGYYSMAQRTVAFPVENLSFVVTRVLFPAFSKIQDDQELCRASYLKIVEYISFFTVPMMVVFYMTAPEIVRIAYGMKWEPMVILLQILCITGLLKSIGSTVGIIYLGHGRADLAFRLEIVYTSLIGVSISIGLMWGVVGVAVGYATAIVFIWPISHYFANRIIGLSMRRFFSTLGPVSVASLLMLITLTLLKSLKSWLLYLDDLQFLSAALITGPAVYLLVIKILKVGVVGEIAVLIGDALKLRQFVGTRGIH